MAPTRPENRLTLTSQTRLSDLTDFLARQKSGHELLARTDKEGNTVLYTRGTHGADFFRNLKDKMRDEIVGEDVSNKFDAKRERATKAISDFLKTQAEHIGTDLKEKSDFIKLHDPDQSSTRGKNEILGVSVRNVLFTTGQVYEGMHLAARTIDVKSTLSVLDHLNLVTSRADALLDSKIRTLDVIPDLPPTTHSLREGGENFDFMLDGEARQIHAPNLLLDGKEFSPVEFKGGGGFGAVIRYQDNDGNSVAVKLPFPNGKEPAEQKKEAAKELFNTERLVGDSPHLSGFSSHVEVAGGFVALVGELIPNGSVNDLAGQITARFTPGDDSVPPPPGRIGEFERRLIGLTLLTDTAKGLAHIQDQGLTHGDVKSLNVMIDGDGQAKLIDLGESTKSNSLVPGVLNFGDNALYAAPEAKLERGVVSQRREAVNKANEEFFATAIDSLLDTLSDKMTDDTVGKEYRESAIVKLKGEASDIAEQLMNFASIHNNSDVGMGASFDSFGLGTMGIDLLLGGNILENTGDKKADKHLKEWVQSREPAIGERGLITRSTGDINLDDFLNGMLDSNPETRMTPREITENSFATAFGVGSPEVRDLIVALASKDEGRITDAVARLRDAYYVDA